MLSYPRSLVVLLFCLLFAGSRAETASPPIPATVDFNRDIRPILSNTCFKCHGPDVANNKSGLRLDVSEAVRTPHTDKSGRTFTAIVPGKPEASEVWRRIISKDPDLVMPPPDSLHSLSARDQALIRRWIEQGARYDAHWAYVPVVKRTPPNVPGAPDHPIDRFIRAELAHRGIKPSPEADRRTLLRRVSLDLTGLPPTPAEVESFLSDRSPDAYERVVDRLLASPHYGERMAVPWLDVVRFADSVGFHGDQEQNIFPYRDYIIDSFNRNRPFDQFTIEQIAGDLLPDATDEQRVASGFNRLNMMTREGGAQPKEYLAKYAADRVRGVSTTWLGSTMGCAECHDHKYDPFSTRDFYTMAAYFADLKQWGVYNDYVYTPEPELEGFNNDYPFPPEIEITSPALVRRAENLRKRIAQRESEEAHTILADAGRTAALRQWITAVAPRVAANPAGWAPAPVEAVKSSEETVTTVLPDGSLRFGRTPPPPKSTDKPPRRPANRHELTIDAPAGPLSTVRLEMLPDELHDGKVGRDGKTRFNVRLNLAILRAGKKNAEPAPVAFAFAEQDAETYFNGKVLPSVAMSWRSAASLADKPQAAVYHLHTPVVLSEGDRLQVTLVSADAGRCRFSVSPLGGRLPADAMDADTRAAFAAANPSDAQLGLLAEAYARSVGTDDCGHSKVAIRQLTDLADCREGRTHSMVSLATEPRITRVLARGNWQDDSGEIVEPAAPHFLPGAKRPKDAARATRLDLARWIVSRENPLTARTFVNRLWKEFFGTGLSAVVDDLGQQGEYPSHPELLDWLAMEFMDRGWDVKAVVKLMVTSATYRQSSTYRPELADIDPDNRLLARQNPRRLDAEFVRDTALFAAGLLNPEIGGPSARPYQPEGYYEPINFPRREYVADSDERQYRRGLYMHWQRTFLHPMLANFDATSREECTASRNLSTTPQQALTLLNDPTFVEASRVLAERLLHLPAERRLDEAFARVLGRPPADRERESLTAFYRTQHGMFQENPEDARELTAIGLRPVPGGTDLVELAAWTSVARVLINLNETIVRY